MKKSIPAKSGKGIRAFHSWEWTGTGIPAHPCYHHLANRSPDAALRKRAFPQVVLLETLPILLNILEGLQHGDVVGELEDVLGEALLGDASATLLRQFTQPVSVTSKSSKSSKSS